MMNNNTELRDDRPWVSDQGNGMFVNPILHADYSDPDAIRVGDDFYMTASSFGHIPGLPILHSKDLVNWRLINHAIQRMPLDGYDRPQHGNGVWAPSIRYHAGKYWIFYGDPDVGIFMTTADDPAGAWSDIHLVQEGKGLIDACPFWDDNGDAYLVHAYAQSRSGIKHQLRVRRMSADGSSLLDEGIVVIHDPERHPTIEGPKMYKRNGYYYIFAPAGGVEEGWQTVLRATHPYGPYEDRIVLKQGDSPINGPHQGAWVELASGESWFMHFQHKDAYGRIVHLQPMSWGEDDWPTMGFDSDGDGIGEPVLRARKPDVGGELMSIEIPATSDGFDTEHLGLQWQWQANPEPHWYSMSERLGRLRLYAQRTEEPIGSLFAAPYLLMQKFPSESFETTVIVDGEGLRPGDCAGLIVFGYRYAALTYSVDEAGSTELVLVEGDTERETEVWRVPVLNREVSLRVVVSTGGVCKFSYCHAGERYVAIEAPDFVASVSKWVGAKVGIYSQAGRSDGGYVDFDEFRMAASEAKDVE
ncbi:glycoside hydrolase family 43 protein [Paenibacillus sp. strain BS8-2]